MEESTTTQPKKINPFLIIGGVVVLALIGFGIVYANSNNTSSDSANTATPPAVDVNQETPQMESEANTTPAVEGEHDENLTDSDVQVVEIEAGSFYFKPNEIRVKKGQTVKITMTAKDMMHDFVIDELNVKMPVVQNGTTGTVEFTADEVGEFEFYCSVGQHRKLGQVGTLIVEE